MLSIPLESPSPASGTNLHLQNQPITRALGQRPCLLAGADIAALAHGQGAVRATAGRDPRRLPLPCRPNSTAPQARCHFSGTSGGFFSTVGGMMRAPHEQTMLRVAQPILSMRPQAIQRR